MINYFEEFKNFRILMKFNIFGLLLEFEDMRVPIILEDLKKFENFR